MTYIVNCSKNSNLPMVEPSATLKMDKWCIYSAYVMHAFVYILLHGGYIYYMNLYGTDGSTPFEGTYD